MAGSISAYWERMDNSMPIPEEQLATWSHQGSVQQSSATYQTIRTALMDPNAAYADKDSKVFLQGSYGNDTNIYAESDVDVVIYLDSIWRRDLSALPPEQQTAYSQAHDNATYTFDEFKRGVVNQLYAAFGTADVTSGNKSIKIKSNGSRRSADVVACYQYRRYIRFINISNQEYITGVIFPSVLSGEIINYPELHSDNCTVKHQATSGWFKPMVRIMKNMRSLLVDDSTIAKDTAPSYNIEGMLWNVPNEKFGGNYGDTFYNCINWLVQTDRSKLRCANEQYRLLGESNVQWPFAKCDMFLNAVVKLWEEW